MLGFNLSIEAEISASNWGLSLEAGIEPRGWGKRGGGDRELQGGGGEISPACVSIGHWPPLVGWVCDVAGQGP